MRVNEFFEGDGDQITEALSRSQVNDITAEVRMDLANIGHEPEMSDIYDLIEDNYPGMSMDDMRTIGAIVAKASGIREGAEDDYEQVDEAAIRQFKKKRGTNTLERRYRCTSGPKAGKMAANPNACNRRPDPKKRRHGRKVMRVKKATIQRKSRVAKRKTISKTLTRLNARLMSKDVTPSDFSSNK